MRPCLLLLVGLTACHGNPLRRSPSTVATSATVASPGTPRLSDEHVASVALMANNVEIAYAMIATDRASDAEVKTYAARMRTDHTSINASLTDLLARADLEAQDDPAGLALRDASVVRRARLQRLTGRAFDSAYLEDDVVSHREMLDVVDRVLIPNARRRELHDYVAALRPAVAAHLAHAEQLRATLAARRQ